MVLIETASDPLIATSHGSPCLISDWFLVDFWLSSGMELDKDEWDDIDEDDTETQRDAASTELDMEEVRGLRSPI